MSSTSGRQGHRRIRHRGMAVVALLSSSVAACSGDDGNAVPPNEIGHVHDLIVDDDGLLVATHRGLLRLADGSYRRVGDEVHDLMAMTRGPGGDIFASGHPDLRLEQYRVDGQPSFLGLVRSTDDGTSWDVVDWLGEVDFHAIVPDRSGLLAGDSTGTVWRFDGDGDGQPVGAIAFDINDLAVSPGDPGLVLATSWDGELAISDDAAQTWAVLADMPPITELEWTAEGVIGATADGELWSATSPTGPFTSIGVAPGELETLLVEGDMVWAATHGGQIHRREADESWTPLVGAVE